MKKSFSLGIIMAILLSMLIIPSYAQEPLFTKGDGSAQNPFVVNTAEQLQQIGTVGATYFLLGNDIDLQGASWTPIGTYTVPFEGVLDGGDHKILNLNITSADDLQGLFGRLGIMGVVKNLTLENAKVKGKDNVSGLVAINGGTVRNCKLTGQNTIEGRKSTGGLVGDNWTGSVLSCVVTAAVVGDEKCGLIAGDNSNAKEMAGCAGFGTVSGNNKVGGLTGANAYGMIRSCYVEATVTAPAASGAVIGEIQPQTVNGLGILSNESFYNVLLQERMETAADKMNIVTLQNEMRWQMYRSIVQDYIERVLVCGENGVMLQWSNSFGSLNDGNEVEGKPFFASSASNTKLHWLAPEDSIVSNNIHVKKVIPMVRPFFDYSGIQRIGYLYLELSTSLLEDILNKYELSENGEVFLFNERGIYIAHNDSKKIGKPIEGFAEISGFLQEDSGNKSILRNGVQVMMVHTRSEYTGWTIVQSVPMSDLNVEQNTFLMFSTQVILVCIVFVALISMLLSANLTKPIKRIVARVKIIEQGDFSVDRTIESKDEIGQIGRVINDMSQSIGQLVEENVQKEKSKRDLEIKVLQSQINPHFLYNTLNSIKWMATIQKNESIARVVVSLSRLLRNVAVGVSRKIPLAEEISLLKEYVNIQKIRYGEKFEVYYDEELDHYADCLIVNLTLQPLVENAIFHGIEPKEGQGNIYISVCSENNKLHITVEDDGIGMEEAALQKDELEQKNRFSGIGLQNIHERLQITYGQDCGLTMESESGSYTRAIVTISKKTKEGAL